MPKYTVKVTLMHTFTQTEEYEATVEADDAQEAEHAAEQEARKHGDRDCFEAEWDETRIDNTEIIKCDEDPNFVPRCDKTADLFSKPATKETANV